MAMEDLQAELAALEAKRAEKAAARAARDAEAEVREQIEAAKQEIEDAEVIERFEDELGPHGRKWRAVNTRAGVVVVKRPHPATFKAFRDTGKYKSKVVEDLVRPCVAHPAPSELTSILNDYPALLDKLADAVFELAEGRARDISGK